MNIVLAGNPNVGKSAVFHGLTGIYAEVSNYPGTTVEITAAKLHEHLVLDTPGVYGVSSFNEEERVAREVILEADLIVNVVDAAHLDRDLFLTVQLIDMGFPAVVALNMMDEARAAGLSIDTNALSAELGVEVVPTVATRGQGIDRLHEAIGRAKPGRITPEILPWLPAARPPAEAVLIAEDDRELCVRQGIHPAGTRERVYRLRRERVDRVVATAVRERAGGARLSTILGRWALHPVLGIVILAAFMTCVYYLVGIGVAGKVVDVTEKQWMGGYYVPWVTGITARIVRPDSFIGQVLVGEFGLLTMTVSYMVGLLLPLVAGVYLVLSFMEDSGYLPRVAVLADRLMAGVGLNGRAVIPMILGLGCVTMATMTTRLMGTKRERTIATFLLSLAIPCSAQLAVIAVMLAPLGPSYSLLFVLLLAAIYGIAGVAVDGLVPGRSSDLLIDLPPLRWPKLSNMLHKTFLKAKTFLVEAGGLFAAGALAVSILNAAGGLGWLESRLAPLTQGWLGLPPAAGRAFIMGFVRRDFGAAGLYSLSLTPHQTLVALVTITLFVPCIASIMIMLKECGRFTGAAIWVADLAIAILVGGLVHRALFW